MTVKFPLKMKNGVQVRNLSDLKENFDVESIVSYFLDDKLETWLTDRYYEEEAELVSLLDKNDPELVKKLYEIFDIDYIEEETVSPKKIAIRNSRIAKLKQFTDGDKFISNIDSVAFDQEELVDLYDKGIEKIYLCEGVFRIPKSKRHLEYIKIGNVNAQGLEEAPAKREENTDSNYYSIPEELADKIMLKEYFVTDDYVIYKKKFCEFFLWDKCSKTETRFHFSLDIDYDLLGAWENKILAHNGSDVLLYDIDTDCSEIICTDYRIFSFNFDYSISNGKFVYLNEDNKIRMYDIALKKNLMLSDKTNMVSRSILVKDRLFYAKDRTIYEYDIKNGEEKIIFEAKERIDDLWFYNETLYIKLYISYENYEVASVTINSESVAEKIDNLMNCYRHPDAKTPYFAYVKKSSDLPLYLYNMKTKELKQIALECGSTKRLDHWFRASETLYYSNSCNIVGNYLYYNKGKKGNLCRVNLLTGEIEDKGNLQ